MKLIFENEQLFSDSYEKYARIHVDETDSRSGSRSGSRAGGTVGCPCWVSGSGVQVGCPGWLSGSGVQFGCLVWVSGLGVGVGKLGQVRSGFTSYQKNVLFVLLSEKLQSKNVHR